MNEFDTQVRPAVYHHFVQNEDAPSAADVARALKSPTPDVEASFHRLHAEHVLVLKPGTHEICMAMPFSAVPTPFRVRLARQSYWANCIWDALGIPAMLDQDARILTHYDDFDDPPELCVQRGQLSRTDGVIHFALPAAKWWDDIGYT